MDMVIESEVLPLLLNSNCCWAKADVVEVDLKKMLKKAIRDIFQDFCRHDSKKKNNLIETAFKKAVNSTGKLRNSTCE